MKRGANTRCCLLVVLSVVSASLSAAESDREILRRIPPVDRAWMAANLRPRWLNPVVHIGATAVRVTWMTGESKYIPVDELVTELARLPNSAWPYGRIIHVDRPGIYREGDRPGIEATERAVNALLTELAFEISPTVMTD